MKKKLLIMFCFLAGIALTILGGFHYLSVQKESQYATTAVPYIKKVIPELSKWDPDIARKYLSQEFLEKTPEEFFNQTIRALAKIGSLQAMEEPHFEEVYSGDTPKGEKETIISYTVKATYSTGDALITLTLLDRGGVMSVYRFNVQSAALGH